MALLFYSDKNMVQEVGFWLGRNLFKCTAICFFKNRFMAYFCSEKLWCNICFIFQFFRTRLPFMAYYGNSCKAQTKHINSNFAKHTTAPPYCVWFPSNTFKTFINVISIEDPSIGLSISYVLFNIKFNTTEHLLHS